MNQVKVEQQCQRLGPGIRAPVCQQISHNQSFEFFQRRPADVLAGGTQTPPSMAMTSAQTPQPPLSTFQYYGDVVNTRRYSLPPMSGSAVRFLQEGTHKLMSIAMTSTQTLQPPTAAPVRNPADDTEIPRGLHSRSMATVRGSTGDMTPCQLHKPSSSLPQGVAGASAHSSTKPPVDALQKRELRLMKNREAARECRRKKKEYVKCLENRVAVLENQNKTLIEELRALKDIYRHKVEGAARGSRRRRKDCTDRLQPRNASLEMENETLKARLQSFKNLTIRLPNPVY